MKVFTTGQVARICKVAPRTVSKWFDSGRLKGYRIPGSQDRRIPREYLIKFMKEHGMSLDKLEKEVNTIIVFSQDRQVECGLGGQMDTGKYNIIFGDSVFATMIRIEDYDPVCIIVDFAFENEALEICRELRTKKTTSLVVAVLSHTYSLAEDGLCAFSVNKPLEYSFFCAKIRTLIGAKKELE